MTIKNVLLCIVIVAALATSVSCHKSSDKPSHLSGATLSGTWEIRDMWGPLIDIDPNAFKPGNGRTWSFSDSTFQQRTKDSVYNSGTYSVSNTGLNPVNNKPVQRFIFNGIPSESFELRNDSLFVYSIVTDEHQYTAAYVKVSYVY